MGLFKRKINKGVTLTEILIVIGVVSFLAVMAAVYLRSQTLKGFDARRKADIKRIGIAVEEYEKDKNCYPLSNLVTCDPGNTLLPYIDKIPCDPRTQASYLYEHEDSVCPGWYRIYSKIENENDVDYLLGIGPNSAYTYYTGSPNAPDVTENGEVAGPDGQGPPPDTDFYGCFSGTCTLIGWDSYRPGPECDPNFQNSTCYGQCANLINECEPWAN